MGRLLLFSISFLVMCCQSIPVHASDARGSSNRDSSPSILSIDNSLIWGNVAGGSGSQICNKSTASIEITSSIVEGYWEHDPAWFILSGHSSILWGPGNSGAQPLCSRTGFLTTSSIACRDSGLTSLLPADVYDLDEDGDTAEPFPLDIQNEARVEGSAVDIGADEFHDADGDTLPDAWEFQYFSPSQANGGVPGALPGDDPDQDGLTNIEEFERYGSNPVAAPIHVNGEYASTPNADGSSSHPYGTIQEALDVASEGDTILIAAGVYAGSGNEDLDFQDHSVVLLGEAGVILIVPTSTPLFTSTPGNSSFLGLTFQSSPEGEMPVSNGFLLLKESVLDDTVLQARLSSLWLDDVMFDWPDAASGITGTWDHCHVRLLGDVDFYTGTLFASSCSIYSGSMVDPNHAIYLSDEAILAFTGSTGDEIPSTLYADILGAGTIHVGAGQVLRVRGGSIIDLQNQGTLVIDGLLSMEDASSLLNAGIVIHEMTLGEAGDINNNNILLVEASSGFGGELFVSGCSSIVNNIIQSEGDRYLDLDPDPEAVPRPVILNNQFYVRVLQGTHSTQGTLLELRTEDYDYSTVGINGESGAFHLPISEQGYGDTWVLEELEILEDAKVTLTNRQGFTFVESDYPEALYVKKLILHPHAILNTGFQRLYYQELVDGEGNPIDPTQPHPNGSLIVDEPLLGFSLAIIALDDDLATTYTNEAQIEFDVRIRKRLRNPLDIDPCGCLGICNPTNPTTPNPSQCRGGSVRLVSESEVQSTIPSWDGDSTIDNGVLELNTRALNRFETSSVAAKGAFAAAGKEDITVFFDYLWLSNDPGDELIVYISDSPAVSACASSNGFASCHYEVGRIGPTGPMGTPGQPGSGQFGTFMGTLPADLLNLTRGVYVELELRSALDDVPASIWINDWDPQILCGEICADFNGSNTLDGADYLTVVASYGETIGPDSSQYCVDQGLGNFDGYIDICDLSGWDTLLGNPDSDLMNACNDPVAGFEFMTSAVSRSRTGDSFAGTIMLASKSVDSLTQNDYLFTIPPSALTTTGDGITVLNPGVDFEQYVPVCQQDVFRTRGFGKVFVDSQNTPYQLHGEFGLLRSQDGVSVIPPREFTDAIGTGDTVCVGFVSESSEINHGMPILDVSFHPTDSAIVYVTPVIVIPSNGHCPYRASAKLHLTDPDQGEYEIVMLYGDDPAIQPNSGGCQFSPLETLSQFQNQREIEVDGEGSVYVINAGRLKNNNYDRLMIYNEDTVYCQQMLTFEDGIPPSPTCLTISSETHQLWLGSTLVPDPVFAGPVSTTLSQFSIEPGEPTSVVTLVGTQEVLLPTGNLPDVSYGFTGAITALHPTSSGDLLAAGFTMPKYPDAMFFTSRDSLFTKAVLARIPAGNTCAVTAAMINSGPALPISILQVSEGGTAGDADGDGDIDLADFARFQQCFGSVDGECLASCDLDHDSDVDLEDFVAFGDVLAGPQ